VLGRNRGGTGAALVAGPRWAIDAGYDAINLSLSTRRRASAEQLRELADRAYFRGALLMCCAHNVPVESFPWRFPSAVSVAGHDGAGPAGRALQREPSGQVLRPWGRRGGRLEGRRVDSRHRQLVRLATRAASARFLGALPALTPFQVKTLLYLRRRSCAAA